MDSKLKADWVKELRGDKFTQQRRVLCSGSEKTSNDLCCLGVLWHLCGRPEGALAGLWSKHLPNGIGVFVDMNDRQEKSFPEIADYIEQHIPSDEQSEPSHG